MKTNIGLNEEARLEVGKMLNLLLSDEYVLYVTTRDYHWNVTGLEFHSLNTQFEAQYAQIADWIDQVAERTRAIGAGALASWSDLMKTARTSAMSGFGLSPVHMLAELLGLSFPPSCDCRRHLRIRGNRRHRRHDSESPVRPISSSFRHLNAPR